MDGEVLLDCPFCGGEGQGYAGEPDEEGERHFVECVQCGARSGVYYTDGEAVRAWQMRHDAPALRP